MARTDTAGLKSSLLAALGLGTVVDWETLRQRLLSANHSPNGTTLGLCYNVCTDEAMTQSDGPVQPAPIGNSVKLSVWDSTAGSECRRTAASGKTGAPAAVSQENDSLALKRGPAEAARALCCMSVVLPIC
jgi:hypothetical protein